MIKINEDDRQTLIIHRGDAPVGDINKIAFKYPIYNYSTEEVEYYEFKPTDEITLNVFEKKGYTHYEVLTKSWKLSDLGYVINTTTPELYLTATDTMVFPLENKKQTYYYEIILNNKTTIIGANEEGTNKLIVYPSRKKKVGGSL